ncbi:MAG: CRISPR-associated ring nuclease Crn3/Csx3 [Actinomycetota bacterium]
MEAGVVVWDIGVDSPVTPSDPLPSMPNVPRGSLLVLSGRAPIWRYGLALHRANGSPAGAVAVYDPRLGAVVIMTHSPKFEEGQVEPVDLWSGKE